jgi:hypothetical protein
MMGWGQISADKKILFIPIPKTGCTSAVLFLIRNGFSPRSMQQYDCDEIEFVFVFVRNPWDRLVSRYEHLKSLLSKLNIGKTIGPAAKINLKDFSKFINKKGDLDLEDFTFKKFIYFTMKVPDAHWNPQVWFLKKRVGDLNKINFIGRFENIEQDWKAVCKQVGIPFSNFPHKNKSERKHYTEYYDDSTFGAVSIEEMVAKKYAEDIKQFGYEFGK